MMREEEEREQRREERRRRELEIARLKEERQLRQLRQREDLEFGRIEQSHRQKNKSDAGGFLDWEDVQQDESFESVEVDWQGFPPPPSSSSAPPPKRRRESRRRERRERVPREPREPIKIECPSCTCPSFQCPTFDCTDCCLDCSDGFRKHKKLLCILFCLLVLAGAGVGIYFAVDAATGPGDGTDDDFFLEGNPYCRAVLGGYAVPDESFYPMLRLSWVMDMSSESKFGNMMYFTTEVQEQFQSKAIPVLAGCVGDARDFAFEARYDILNGYVRSVRDVGSCRYGTAQPCARILVDFVVYTRGETAVLDLIGHISSHYTNAVTEAMESMDNVKQTGLVGLFEQRFN
mmetsp:Transcript_35269/g.85515  ORF Transcript_35269/g.85515 Transcript_35269/m.85515 type:complete len:347 (+) Transcript_35269:299-1339(+)